MKNLISFQTTLMFLLVGSIASGQVAEKTVVKSLNLQGNNIVTFDLDGDVEVKEWDKSIMRIQMTISVDNINEATLKALITAGRYNLKSKQQDEDLLVFSPGLEKQVKIRGHELTENVSYEVYAPSDVLIRLANQASSNVHTSKDKKTTDL